LLEKKSKKINDLTAEKENKELENDMRYKALK